MTLMPRAVLALAALSLAGLALAACAPSSAPSGPTAGPTSPPGDDATIPTDLEGTVEAVWMTADGPLALLTWGSSSCPPVVGGVTAPSPTELAVTFAEPAADRVCTMDYAPRLTPVDAPEGVDASSPVTLALTGDGFDEEVTVAPFAGAADTAAGSTALAWMQERTMIALLTYGSSGCPPIVADVAAGADNTIDVSFADPAPDRVCTADLAPRVTAIGVPPGVDPEVPVAVALSGDGFAESLVLEP